MRQPLFFLSNPDRLPQFVLETRIWQDANGRLVAEKRAASEAAGPHLEQFLSTYEKLKGLTGLRRVTHVVPAAKRRDTVIFPYIAGRSLERVLLEAILAKDTKAAGRLIGQVVGLVGALPESTCNPTDDPNYTAIFGRLYDRRLKCATIGLIDINFDNFIVAEDGALHLIDYEWVFDFAVPKSYLLQRLFWWFVVRYQETFRYHGARITGVYIADNVFVPQVVYDAFKSHLENLEELLAAESAFQTYVAGHTSKSMSANFYAEPQTETAPRPVGIDRIILHEDRARRLSDHAKKLEARIAELERERNRLRRNPFVRLAYKLSRPLRRAS